jgi:lysophospholipase L1-like esterase
MVGCAKRCAISSACHKAPSPVDADGQFYFLNRPVRPYTLPVASTTDKIDAYLESSTSYVIYDPDLGWTIRSNSESLDGLYKANSAGLRAEVDYDLSPQPEVVRIAIFGDSFTHGTDVPFGDSWGQRLEALLNERGLDVEVLNFGVGGYGMDQAFLRWQHQGSSYSPDIVLFGFQPENVYRNFNTFRPFYFRGSAIPFTKPRFALDGDELELVNSPTIPPEQIPDTIAHFAGSPLAEYDFFFDEADFTDHWWLESRLFALFFDMLSPDPTRASQFYDLNSEPTRLTLAVIQAFETDVEASGAQFMIVTLPSLEDLRRVKAGRPLTYAEFLDHLDANYKVVHTEGSFEGDRLRDYFEPSTHYSIAGNRVIADAVADELHDQVITLEQNDD